MLAVGLALSGIASLACGLAQWGIMLIIARIVQGAAGAMISPAALSLLTTTNAEGAARNRALAIWQATIAAGATAGIVAGGLFTQYFGWRALFLINPPVIAIMLALVPRLPAGKRSGGGGSVDVRGALLVTTGIAAVIFGLSNKRPFTGMLDRHPRSASGRGGCSLAAFLRRSSFPCSGARECQWRPFR